MLDPGVVIALERWRRLGCAAADDRTEIFGGGDDSLDEEHLAATFRAHLTRSSGMAR